MRHRDHLVLVLLERLFDLRQLRTVPDGRFQLRDLDAVGLEAIGKGVCEVAGVKDEDVVAGLHQVRCHEVPAQGAGS